MLRAQQRFDVIGAAAVRAILAESRPQIVDIVRAAYRLHHAGGTTNPDSYFLRFPDRPSARIIALPARLRDGADVAGIKWISSFPGNHDLALPRASAVIVLNDMATGFPYACLEGSYISAARTAASAALAAGLLHPDRQASCMAVIGAGPIAATVVDFLLAAGWRVGQFGVHDLIVGRAAEFCADLRARGHRAEPASTAEMAIRGAELVLFATTAAKPHLDDPAVFAPEQTVLHVSLRDLGVAVILSAQNIADDVEHCLKAQTSLHLAEQATGGRRFVAGAIGDLLCGGVQPDAKRPRIFSPFGLGVLDLAVARFVYEQASASGRAAMIEDFFVTA